MTHTYEYPRPSLTVDCVIFGFDPDASFLKVLLIRRADDPFKGHLAIPGGFVEVRDDASQGESIEDAARRELKEETGITVAYLEQLYTFGTPGRDPRGRVITVAYVALVRQQDYIIEAGSDAAEASWFSVESALGGYLEPLAFDHRSILKLALQRLQGKIRYAPIGFNLLPDSFTLGDLRKLYETLLGRPLDMSNFNKKVGRVLVRPGVLVKTGDAQKGFHRPAPLYRFDREAYDRAVLNGFNFEI
jgi:8-oxo-dGTP diphosphatase